jgi:hypothetical protein
MPTTTTSPDSRRRRPGHRRPGWRALALVALATLAALGTGLAPARAAAEPLPGACLRAEDFGAHPNDDGDDRDQLQAAIDAAQAGPRCLVLGPGEFHATRRQTAGTRSIASLRITGPLSLRGAGQGVTSLGMFGPGTCTGCQGFPNPTDWNLLEVTAGATGVSINDLTLEGTQRTSGNEQTHLLQLTGPTQGVRVERVSFDLPVIGPSAGGDCIRLLGSHTAWVRDTTIRDVTGLDCDRSFVGFQRGVDGVLLERSRSIRVGDQAVDFEPTGGPVFECQPIVRNVTMRDLVLRRTATGQGDRTVTIHGDGCAVADNVTLADSIIEDGSVSVLDAHHLTLSGLHLRNRTVTPTLLARKRIVGLQVRDSTIERVAGTGPGSAIVVTGQNGAFPTDVVVSGTHVIQATDGPLVRTEDARQLLVQEARLTYTGPPSDQFTVVVRSNGVTPVDAPVLIDTVIEGDLAGAARVAGPVNGQPVLIRVTGP